MFNFMKKGAAEREEKEKRKKEKKERKENKKRDRGSMTTEELLRLDEVRRSLKIRGRRKEKEKLPSGITADYSASFFASLEQGPDYPGGSSSLPGHHFSGTPASPSPSSGTNCSWMRSGGETLTQSDSSEASLTSLSNPQRSLPPLPPRPPKRGILKGPRLSIGSVGSEIVTQNGGENHTDSVLVRNTLQNEVIAYQNVPQMVAGYRQVVTSSGMYQGAGDAVMNVKNSIADGKLNDLNCKQSEELDSALGSGDYLTTPPITVATNIEITNKLLTVTSASPSADSLTDTTTTNSSFATPPFSLSPIGESQGFASFHNRWNRYSSGALDESLPDLPLPPIIPVLLPKPRVLTIQRQPPPRGDFGFSLRRAMVVERLASGQMKAVIFAEPGTIVQHHNETGLLPGDRLLEVNGVVVDDKSREEIIDLIKSSSSSVTVKVQPVPELSELTRRSALDGSAVELDDANIRGGTLRRSGSRRFKSTTRDSVEGSVDMLKLGAFENSLRGGPDVPPPPKTKKQLLQLHHKSCSGDAHGCGIDKFNRAGHSDTDSGRESLTSPHRPSADEDVSSRLHATPTRASAAKSALYEDEAGVRLSMRRKKRNQRVAEHVDGAPLTSTQNLEVSGKSGVCRTSSLRSTDSVRRPLTSTDSLEDCGKKKDSTEDVSGKASVCRTTGDPTRRPLTSKKDSTEDVSGKASVCRTTGDPTRRPLTSKKDSTEDVSGKGGVCRTSSLRSTDSVRRPLTSTESLEDCGKKKKDSTEDVSGKAGLSRTSSLRSSKREVPLPRQPPKQVAKKARVPVSKVSWSELAEEALNRKPGLGTVLYKELDSLMKARSEEQLATEKAWLDAERLWLVHRGGFTACRRAPDHDGSGDSDVGKLRVRIEATGDTLVVDDDDVEKANPPQFDRAEDLANLRYLNESSVLHTLRQRYGSNLIHTYAGGSMVVINPMAPLAIYSEKVVHMFRGCKSEDMPPHIYSLAQSAYHSMLASRRDQSVVFLGRSGSGKTVSFRHVLHYLVLAAGTVNKVLTVEKLNAIGAVLEAFGNSRTVMNSNATRFTQIFSLDFDQSGQIASASLQILLPERSRVARRPNGEPTFHIFYRLLAGVEGTLRKELFLDSTGTDQNIFMTPLQKHEDKQKAMLEFNRVRGAMVVLGISDSEAKVLWTVLAAIYHLGIAGAVKAGNSSSSRWQFANPRAAQHAAHLLGTTVEELARLVFGQCSGGMGTPSTPRTPFRTPSPTDKGNEREVTGLEALEGFVVGLYGEVFSAVGALINRCISTPIHTVSSLLVVDTPGFQNPASCGQQGGATFEELCHNYLQERLQLLFHHTMLVAPRDRYAQEHIECQLDDCSDIGAESLVSLMDRTSQNAMVRTSQTDLRSADRRGLLWLLDEEAVYPGASDEGFLERLFTHYGDRDHQLLLRKAPGNNQFVLQHLQGTNPVLYTATGWLKASRENPVARNAVALLQECSKEEVSQLFVSIRGTGVSSTLGGSVVGIEGTQSLRRASSIRRTFTTGTAGMKRKSVCLQVKFTVDGLIETLRRTRLKFVHCFLPQHNAGITDNKGSSISRTSNMAPSSTEDALVNVPLIRSQLRGAQILDAVRLHKQGFPKFLPLSEFRRRFRLLAPVEGRPTSPVLDERRAVEDMLLGIDIDGASYRLGQSQIFFRSGVLAQLEAQRDERLTDHVVRLQAQCRGYLARRRLAKLKIQDLAVRCIQRNVRKFMSVRDWPWWRLLVRVTPLLNVHRTEEELRLKTEELEMLRAKVEKLEEERGYLKHDTDRLEAKLSEMTADLAEEHSTATLATERLEAETSERLRLEKELQDVQHENKSLHQQGERLEMELLYMRAADMNGVGSEDEEDGEGDAGVYKQRYERAARELEFTKRRMQQQHEDDLEQLVGLKKQLEKKLADAYEEVEEQRQVVGQWKRKVQKLNAETNDLRLLLEEQSSRNNLLEKKQRKFDAELQLLQDELRQEKQQKERLSREKEMAVAEKYTMEQNLGAVRLELELKEERVAALTQELDELMFGGKTEEEVAHLKKTKHELEKKVKEQEEELDDLAGQVQLLEQAKLRLEMSLEQQRKENRRETAQRDEELEDVRCNAHKKVKALEAQLESEHEERTLLLREKHELERRLSSMEEQERAARATDEDQLHRLKRDLKRTKALLRDAQTMLERARCESPGKALIRQLRNQLEDAEFARSAAVKARQGAELELQEVQGQLEEAQRARSEAEERAVAASKERSELRTQLEENEEELAEVLKKYRAAVQQLSVDQLALQEQAGRVAELESERASLREQLAELGSRLESMETLGDPSSSLMQKRLELRTKELESKLELEQTTRSRLEVQITRLKEAVEKLQDEAASARAKEQLAQDNARKLQRTLRELREEHTGATAREAEAQQRRRDLEKRLETAEAEASAARGDLRLALTRIEDLQSAMQGELEDDLSNSDGDNSESDHESEGSDESISAFLANHKVRVNSSPRAARPSFELDITSRSVEVTKKPTETSGKESFA